MFPRRSRQFDSIAPAFSLAELMIALVILGIGLLFIAAALPVGVEYAKRNVDRSAAEAAGAYAANTIEQYVRTSRLLVDSASLAFGVVPVPRTDAIFRPRWIPPTAANDPANFVPRVDLTPTDPAAWVDYEPIIKVRPFVMRNINFDGPPRHVVDACENVIEQYLRTIGISPGAADAPAEMDVNPFAVQLALWQNPIAPATARFFPPAESITRFTVADFFQGDNGRDPYARYEPRRISNDESTESTNGMEGVDIEELRRARDQRIAWTAFYRRVSYTKYAIPPAGGSAPLPIEAGDPYTYELIIVVTQRPTTQHRYPHQLVRNLARFNKPVAASSGAAPFNAISSNITGFDRIAPMPWLIAFKELPAPLRFGTQWKAADNSDSWSERYIDWGKFSDAQRPTLRFVADLPANASEGSGLYDVLPPGSILIPARNDHHPGATANNFPEIGFLPSAPDTLPIYRVVDRQIDRSKGEAYIYVENNGFYPWWQTGSAESAASKFPFWIIPPAFAERTGTAPLYEDRTSVVAVIRKIITIPEMQ